MTRHLLSDLGKDTKWILGSQTRNPCHAGRSAAAVPREVKIGLRNLLSLPAQATRRLSSFSPSHPPHTLLSSPVLFVADPGDLSQCLPLGTSLSLPANACGALVSPHALLRPCRRYTMSISISGPTVNSCVANLVYLAPWLCRCYRRACR